MVNSRNLFKVVIVLAYLGSNVFAMIDEQSSVKTIYIIPDDPDKIFERISDCLINFKRTSTDQVTSYLIALTEYDSHIPKIFQLSEQLFQSNKLESCECLFQVIFFIVLTKGLYYEQTYQIVNQAFTRREFCHAALHLLPSLVYHNQYINEAITMVHCAEQYEEEFIRNAARNLRLFLVTGGHLIEETAALAGNVETKYYDAILFYQALVQSGRCLDEAFVHVKQIAEQAKQEDIAVDGILGFFALLLLQEYRTIEVKECARAFMLETFEPYYYEKEFSRFAEAKCFGKKTISLMFKYYEMFKENTLLMNPQMNDICKSFFNVLLTAPNRVQAKESCQAIFMQQGIDFTTLIDVLFESRRENL